MLECRAAAILQMAVGRVGGLLEAKKVAHAADAYYVDIAPHLYAGPVEAAANVHLDVSTPNFLIQESIEQMGGFPAEIVKRPLVWQDGFLLPPESPGLGVELDDDVIARHPYPPGRLHLETGEHEEFSPARPRDGV